MNILCKGSKFRRRQISGVVLVLVAILVAGLTFNYRGSQVVNNSGVVCQEIVQAEAAIAPAQLSKLQEKPGAAPQEVHQLLGPPYCVLPKASIRSGIITIRETYLLKDSAARIILAYESGQYIGHDRDPIELPQSNHKEIELKRSWGLHTGDSIFNHAIVGGLGGLSIETNQAIYAPTDGLVYGQFVFIDNGSLVKSQPNCILFVSPYMPAYLLQLCGLTQRNLGAVRQGQTVGKARGYLHVALLRQDGQWVFVSPAKELLKRLLLKQA